MIPLYVPIAPTSSLELLQQTHSMHFCLLHEIAEDPDYRAAYIKMSAAGQNYIIMDNGAFELGAVPDLETLRTYIEMVQPNEFILPDRMFFGGETLRRSTEAFPVLRQAYPGLILHGVPHGRNIEEWFDCMRGMLDLGVDVIGIPKDYEAWPGGRRILLNLLLDRMKSYAVEVHFLGMEARAITMLEQFEDRELGAIRSIDSVKLVLRAMRPFIAKRPEGYFKIPTQSIAPEAVNFVAPDDTTPYLIHDYIPQRILQ